MTREEAVDIRSRQLRGEPVSRALADEAQAVIRATGKGVYRTYEPRRILSLLTSGPIARDEFMSKAIKNKRTYDAIRSLSDRGLIRCEMRVTEEGLKALGLKGPEL